MSVEKRALARPARSAVLESVAIQATARQIVPLFTMLHLKLLQCIVSLLEPS